MKVSLGRSRARALQTLSTTWEPEGKPYGFTTHSQVVFVSDSRARFNASGVVFQLNTLNLNVLPKGNLMVGGTTVRVTGTPRDMELDAEQSVSDSTRTLPSLRFVGPGERTETSSVRAWTLREFAPDFMERASRYQAGSVDRLPVPEPVVTAIVELAEMLSIGRYRPFLTTDREGGLTLELRLDEVEELFLHIDRDGNADAAISREGQGIQPLEARTIPEVVGALCSLAATVA